MRPAGEENSSVASSNHYSMGLHIMNVNCRTNVQSNTHNRAHIYISIDHNDRCEACEEVGDLICCDTCNLVFHLECIRPAQKVVPRGQWNCAYCMERGVGIGHVKKNRLKEVVRIAEKAVRQYEEAKVRLIKLVYIHRIDPNANRFNRQLRISLTHPPRPLQKTKGIASNYVPREIPLSVTIGSGGRSSPPKKMSPIGKILPPSSTKLSPSSNSPSQTRMRSPVRPQDLNKSPLETNKPSPSAKRGPGEALMRVVSWRC